MAVYYLPFAYRGWKSPFLPTILIVDP